VWVLDYPRYAARAESIGSCAAVRGFLRHGVAVGSAPVEVLAMLFEISDDRHLPVEARRENALLNYVARPRHRLSEPEIRVDRASDDEVLALLGACRSARDRFIVVTMSRAGLRRGEVCGLRREDIAFRRRCVGSGLRGDRSASACAAPGEYERRVGEVPPISGGSG
jgi:integrase